MSIKLITFDLDDTLWALKPVLLRAEERVEKWLDDRYPELASTWTRERLFALRRSLIEQRPELRHRISDLRRAALYSALLDSGLGHDVAERAADEAFEVFIGARHEVDLFEDVEEALLDLSAEFQLAALTNGNADVFRLELGAYFSFAIRAEEVDASKPDPLMFAMARDRAGVSRREMLHVGDHVEQDVAAALDFGIRAIWANLDGADWPLPQRPDGEMRRFRELPALVRRLAAESR
jgi:putative hydrolase of the HAD superfamily